MKKRIFSILLALIMVLSLMPVTAFAECAHTDADGDCVCDDCSEACHVDEDYDCACDTCGETVHFWSGNYYTAVENGHYSRCDWCSHYDEETFEPHAGMEEDGFCDICEYVAENHTHWYPEDNYRGDCQQHYIQCHHCGHPDPDSYEAHYDEDSDGICDICEINTIHTFDFGYHYAEEEGHYLACDSCDYYDEEIFEPHEDDDGDGSCDVCLYILSNDGHEHTFNDGYYYEVEDGHYNECDICTYYDEETFEPHVDEDGDFSCNLCGWLMEHTHYYPEGNYDGDCVEHWLMCCYCGEGMLDGNEPHEDADGDNICDICAITMTHTFDYGYYHGEEEGHYLACDSCDYYDEETFEPHEDADDDSICDICEYELHYECVDEDGNFRCDICWEILPHDCVDEDGNFWCDICWEGIPHDCVDADGNFYCDLCWGIMPHEHIYENKEYDREDEGHYLCCDVCGERDENSLEDHADEDGNELCDACLYFMYVDERELTVTNAAGDVLHDGDRIGHGDVLTANFPAGLRYYWYTWELSPGEGTSTDLSLERTYTVNGAHFGNATGNTMFLVVSYPDTNEHVASLELYYVPAELKILAQPENDEAKLGETYEVSIEAAGEDLQYQWYYRNRGKRTFFKSSVTGSVYSDVMTEDRAGRTVYCVVTDRFGNSLESDRVTISGIPTSELTITRQPQDDAVKMGETYSISLEAQGEGLTYKWYFKSKGHTEFHESDVQGNAYTNVLTEDRVDRQVYCVVTDRFGNSLESEVATIRGIPGKELKITRQPESTTVDPGETYSVSLEAEGEGLTYRWYFKSKNHDEFHKSSVKAPAYSGEMTVDRANRQVYCVVTDMWGNSVTSETVTLRANSRQELKITQQPENGVAALGETYSVRVEAEGEGLRYQWYYRENGRKTFFKSSVKGQVYSDVMTEARVGRTLYCVITDVWGNSVTTERVNLALPD